MGVDSLGNRPFRQLMGLWLRPGPRRGVALPAGQDDLGVDRWRHAARACLSAALVASAALCPPGIAEGESGSSLPDLPLPAAGAAELRAPESGSPERLPAETWPAEVQAALEQAGENRWALEAVLRQYRDRGDSLGLRAASFLIANMEGHSYVRFGLFDSTGRAIDFDVLNYPDYDALLASVEEIEKRVGTTDFERVEVRNDLETMPASLLIENVDCALRAWRERPWAPGLPFELFCNFVLPYRGSNEPLESWRPHFLGKYADLPQAMQDPRDPIEAARLINADLRDWFRFDPRYYHHPTDQGLSEMLANHIGRCEDMTNLTIYAMRANGLAVTSDYTPYWADAGNNHAWNAIVDARGHAVIFMGAEAQPGEYALHNKAAKVYRKSYAHQRGNLAFIKNETEKVPGWLAGKNFLDVTASYGPVTDVAITLARPAPDSVHFAYLCVFNSGEWQAVHWGPIEGGRVTFTAMAREIVYLPGFYLEERIVPAAPAFILTASGEVRPLLPREALPASLRFSGTTRRSQAPSTDGIQATFLTPGKVYELFYWRDKWASAGKAPAGSEPLVFAGVPSGALYWLVEEGSRREERIFTYENDAQVWW